MPHNSIRGDIECVVYSSQYKEGAMQAIRYFIRDSPYFIAACITDNPESMLEMEQLYSAALENNQVSFVAIDRKTDQVVGLALNILKVFLIFLQFQIFHNFSLLRESRNLRTNPQILRSFRKKL
jgi:hypothetical protein